MLELLRRIRISLFVRGLFGIIVAFVLVLFLFGRSLQPLSPNLAETAVRHYLKWQTSQTFQTTLQETGQRIPDEKTALSWERQLKAIDTLKLASIEVRRALLPPPLRKNSEFIVRVTFEGNSIDSRYFRLVRYDLTEGARVLWETGKFEWIFPL